MSLVYFSAACKMLIATTGCVMFGNQFHYSNPMIVPGICGTIGGIAALIIFNPPSRKCYFDESIKVDENNWSVTLVSTNDKRTGHAKIVIEGFSNGKTISTGYHLMLTGFLTKPEVLKSDSKKAFGRTLTWKTSAAKAKKMLNMMEYESKHPETINFNICGCESIFAKVSQFVRGFLFGSEAAVPRHNCITWAIEKLKIVDVHLNESALQKFITLPTLYVGK